MLRGMPEVGTTLRSALVTALFAANVGCAPVEVPAEAVDTTPVAAPEAAVARDVDVRYAGPGDDDAEPAGAPPRASRADHPPPDPVPFRLGAGRGALGRLDLAPCREQGLPQGYLHVRVTFRHNGRVVHAAVESPASPPDEALSCIGEQLQTVAMVPAFDGGDVTISKSYFVN
jgi:hypothetical protein